MPSGQNGRMGSRKVAIVVGVGPGAGAGIARKFAAHGYAVALVSRRLEPLAEIEHSITQAGGTARSFAADSGKEADVRAAHVAIVEQLGHAEVLVYNAGPGGFTYPPPPLLDIDVHAFSHSFDGGVTGALIWMQQVIPEQVKAGKGTILLTGATASLRGSAKFAPLACSKFALRALGQSAAREFQPKGIHVAHIIIDGLIDSPRIRKIAPDAPPDTILSADAIGEAYWQLHAQHRSAWTQELDLRPFSEKF